MLLTEYSWVWTVWCWSWLWFSLLSQSGVLPSAVELSVTVVKAAVDMWFATITKQQVQQFTRACQWQQQSSSTTKAHIQSAFIKEQLWQTKGTWYNNHQCTTAQHPATIHLEPILNRWVTISHQHRRLQPNILHRWPTSSQDSLSRSGIRHRRPTTLLRTTLHQNLNKLDTLILF